MSTCVHGRADRQKVQRTDYVPITHALNKDPAMATPIICFVSGYSCLVLFLFSGPTRASSLSPWFLYFNANSKQCMVDQTGSKVTSWRSRATFRSPADFSLFIWRTPEEIGHDFKLRRTKQFWPQITLQPSFNLMQRWRMAEEVRHGQTAINELITCSVFLMEI